MDVQCSECESVLEEYELDVCFQLRETLLGEVELILGTTPLDEELLCFECLLHHQDLREALGQRLPDLLEKHAKRLAEIRGLRADRAAGLHNVPQNVQSELNGLRGEPGIPDFFVSGKSSDIKALLSEYGLEIDEIQSDIGVFVEVKYTFSTDAKAKYQDGQRTVFPALQSEGFDVFVFRGAKNKLWFERYERYDTEWIHCHTCGDKITDPENDACYCSSCR